MTSAFFFLLFSLVQVPEHNVAMAARQMDQVAPAPEGQYMALPSEVPVFDAPFNIDGRITGRITAPTHKPYPIPRRVEFKLLSDNLAGGNVRNGRLSFLIEQYGAFDGSGGNLDVATGHCSRGSTVVPEGYRYSDPNVSGAHSSVYPVKTAANALYRDIGPLFSVSSLPALSQHGFSMSQRLSGVASGGLSLDQSVPSCSQSEENKNGRNARSEGGKGRSPKHPSRPEGHALLGFQILFSIVCILLSMFIGYKAANMIWAAWGIKDWRGELGGVLLCGVSGFIFLFPILLFMLMDLYLLP